MSSISRRLTSSAPCARPRRAASTSPARPARNIFFSPARTTPVSAASSGSIRRCARRAIRSRAGARSPTAPSTSSRPTMRRTPPSRRRATISGPYGPDIVARLLDGGVRRMVGRDDVDAAVGERTPERLLMARLAHRRIDPDDAAETGVVRAGEKKILRAGLAGDVDAARLGLAQGAELVSRRDMEDMDARTGPFGEDGGAAHRLDGDDRGARGEMRERIEAACRAHAGLAPFHDGVGLGMQRDAFAGRRHRLEGFEHRAGRWARDLPERVAHIELEADDAAFDERR